MRHPLTHHNMVILNRSTHAHGHKRTRIPTNKLSFTGKFVENMCKNRQECYWLDKLLKLNDKKVLNLWTRSSVV